MLYFLYSGETGETSHTREKRPKLYFKFSFHPLITVIKHKQKINKNIQKLWDPSQVYPRTWEALEPHVALSWFFSTFTVGHQHQSQSGIFFNKRLLLDFLWCKITRERSPIKWFLFSDITFKHFFQLRRSWVRFMWSEVHCCSTDHQKTVPPTASKLYRVI